MSERFFSYSENGLSYTVRIYEEDGIIKADITVDEGSMDVNAVYIADDDFDGPSAGLGGPLNMNGGGSQFEGERVQWDDAIPLSRPGLGREGTNKETFLGEGDTLTVDLNVNSVEDVDFFGIRATSVNGGDSIKAVSGNPEEHDPQDPIEPEPPVDPEDPETFGKVFFVESFDADGEPFGGFPILAEEPDPNPFNNVALADGTEPTFENYLARYEEFDIDFDNLLTVIFYDADLAELFRLDGPFEDRDDLLAAFDEAMQGMEIEQNLMSAELSESAEPDTEDQDTDVYEDV